MLQKSPSPVPLHPWEWPNRPWTRIHVEYAGPFMGKMFLVLIDSHSKWMELKPVCSATSSTTISALRTIFATFGLPEILISDNGIVFTSEEFRVFIKCNGIRHLTSAPYHPATNGLAERAVQNFKRALKKADLMIPRLDWQDFFIITALLLRHPQVSLLQSYLWVVPSKHT